ncbi:hypothetical protein Q8F55_001495 [Vanrija albida]|uniref:glucan 1,3-beta-glucosidase n=1 Tax=Vanrija albida TaxID=181172 RepID=A0ABR3QG60_9TREE
MSPIAQAATILSLSLLSLSQLSAAAPVLTHHIAPKRYHNLPNAHKWDTYTALPTGTKAAETTGGGRGGGGSWEDNEAWNDYTNTYVPKPKTTTSSSPAASTSNPNTGTDLSAKPRPKTDKLRGVNLGGWLVLEQWITPSLFSQVGGGVHDEYTWGANQEKGRATQLLRQHWDSWITEDDFRQIAAAGLNSVRIPVGTWSFAQYGDEPYITGAQEYLDKAIGWAQTHNIQVLIDLHGAPGSQNGFDNSGRAGEMNWPNSQSYVDHTVQVIKQIADKYTQPQYRQTVTAIFLLNEPAGFKGGNLINALRDFHNRATQAVRQADGTITVILHDAFMTPSYWNGDNNGDQNLIIDTHYYHAFDPAVQALNWQGQIQRVCDSAGLFSNANKPVMAAEWSLAIGAQNLGTDNYGDFLRRFFDVQTQTFERFGAGWTFWCWKTENSAEWSYKDSLANGWIPQDPTQHKYSYEQLCGGGGGGNQNSGNNWNAAPPADNNNNNNGGDQGNNWNQDNNNQGNNWDNNNNGNSWDNNNNGNNWGRR